MKTLARTNPRRHAIDLGLMNTRIRRPTRSLLGYYLSGERYSRVYEGTGRLLIANTPYWRLRIGQKGGAQDPALVELT